MKWSEDRKLLLVAILIVIGFMGFTILFTLMDGLVYDILGLASMLLFIIMWMKSDDI